MLKKTFKNKNISIYKCSKDTNLPYSTLIDFEDKYKDILNEKNIDAILKRLKK